MHSFLCPRTKRLVSVISVKAAYINLSPIKHTFNTIYTLNISKVLKGEFTVYGILKQFIFNPNDIFQSDKLFKLLD